MSETDHQCADDEATPLVVASLGRHGSNPNAQSFIYYCLIKLYPMLLFLTALCFFVLFQLSTPSSTRLHWSSRLPPERMIPLQTTTMKTTTSSSGSTTNRRPVLNYPVIPRGDFGPYKEYSVIHTDRSLNLMSKPFQHVMRDLNRLLKTTYNADKVAIIPGSVLPITFVVAQRGVQTAALICQNAHAFIIFMYADLEPMAWKPSLGSLLLLSTSW